jgi:hypothetical protein
MLGCICGFILGIIPAVMPEKDLGILSKDSWTPLQHLNPGNQECYRLKVGLNNFGSFSPVFLPLTVLMFICCRHRSLDMNQSQCTFETKITFFCVPLNIRYGILLYTSFRALGYRSGGPGSIPGTNRKKKKLVGLEWGALSLVSTN